MDKLQSAFQVTEPKMRPILHAWSTVEFPEPTPAANLCTVKKWKHRIPRHILYSYHVSPRNTSSTCLTRSCQTEGADFEAPAVEAKSGETKTQQTDREWNWRCRKLGNLFFMCSFVSRAHFSERGSWSKTWLAESPIIIACCPAFHALNFKKKQVWYLFGISQLWKLFACIIPYI